MNQWARIEPKRATDLGRARPLLASPWMWALATALVRLVVLASLPRTGAHLAIGEQFAAEAVPQNAIAFLNSRALVSPFTEDEHAYDELGRNIAAGRGFVLDSRWLITTPGQPVMYAGFTYPAFIGLVYWLFGSGKELPVFLIQIVLTAVGAWWVVIAAARVRGPDAGVIAGAFYTFHPTLIWSSLAMMSESICVPIVAILMYALAKRSRHESLRVLLLAVILAVLCLDRSTFGYFVWVVAGILFVEARKRPTWLSKLRPAIAFLAVFVLLVSPWTIRNYIHWKRLIPFSTKAGVNAWMHNHPGLKVELGPRVESGQQPIEVSDSSIQSLPDEPARNAKLMQMFIQFVKSDPAKFVGLVFMRFLIALLPLTVVSQSLGASIAAWYAKGTVLATVFGSAPIVRAHTLWRMAPWVLFAGYWTVMQSLAGAGLRYRIPADPAWVGIVAVLGSVMLSRFRVRRENRQSAVAG